MPKNKKPQPYPDAAVEVVPNPVPIGSQSAEVKGTGFPPNETLGIRIYSYHHAEFAYTDGSGNFTTVIERNFDWPDEKLTLEVTDALRVLATTTFSVK